MHDDRAAFKDQQDRQARLSDPTLPSDDHRSSSNRQSEGQMIQEAEILERAEIYREMARKAFDPALCIEFTERAESYEIVAGAMTKKRPHKARSG